MADARMIARLAELREFEELRAYLEERREAEIEALGRRTFANPEEHDRIEWERLRARWSGIEMALALPKRFTERKEKQ